MRATAQLFIFGVVSVTTLGALHLNAATVQTVVNVPGPALVTTCAESLSGGEVVRVFAKMGIVYTNSVDAHTRTVRLALSGGNGHNLMWSMVRNSHTYDLKISHEAKKRLSQEGPTLRENIRKKFLDSLLEKKDGGKDGIDNSDRTILFGPDLEGKETRRLSLRKVNDRVGNGVFAEEDLTVGTYLGEYSGVYVAVNETTKSNLYYFSTPSFNIGISAEHAGNMTRFFNHSGEPNVGFNYVFYNDRWHVVFFANRPISIGEELRINYGENYWKGHEDQLDEMPSDS